jgi:hypothetical protein
MTISSTNKSTGDQIGGQSANSDEELDGTREGLPAVDAPSDDNSEMPHPEQPPRPFPEGNYESVDYRVPMEQDEEGNDIGPGSETYTGITGHKGK